MVIYRGLWRVVGGSGVSEGSVRLWGCWAQELGIWGGDPQVRAGGFGVEGKHF